MEFWSSAPAPQGLSDHPGFHRHLVGVAVTPQGALSATQPVVSPSSLADLAAARAAQGRHHPYTVLLQHGGPASSRWRADRAVAFDDVIDPVSGRRARAFTDVEVDDVVAAYAAAAAAVRARGFGVAVDISDDGLLHQALSPLQTPSRPELVLRVLGACGPCALMCVVEDLAPGGLDLSAGLAFLDDAVACTGDDEDRADDSTNVVVVTAGSAWFAPLHERKKANQVDIAGVALASSAFAVGRWPGRRVFGRVSASASRTAVAASAAAIGLDGVVVVAD
jgi:hypothetical protein